MNGLSPTRSLVIWPLAGFLTLLFLLPLRGADEAALRAALDRLAGDWSGEVQVKAMDGFVLKTLAATRRVSWDGDTLVSETTLSDGTSDYVVTARQRILLGRLEAAVSRPSQPEDRYLGEVTGGALVWTNAEGNRRDAREQVAERGGALVLETSSVEPVRAFGLSGLVRMEGRLRRPQPSPTSEAPAPAVTVPDRELETWRTRADDAERRAVAAESRVQALETSLAEAQASHGRLNDELEGARRQMAQLETARRAAEGRLAAAQSASEGAAREAAAGTESRLQLESRIGALEATLAAARRDGDQLRARFAELEQAAEQAQRDNERLLATNQRLDQDRKGLEDQLAELRQQAAAVASAPAPEPAPIHRPEVEGTFSGASRDKLIAEVQQMERRVLELESERNTTREQMALAQRQLEETRRLRDDTLVRFQAVVSELNAMREEKERLARANVSLQSELRTAQQASRGSGAPNVGGAAPVVAGPANPATTFDGKTADMVIAALQIIGVTRGDGGEDKAILDGRVYRNGDTVEPQLGIIFLRIEDNSLVFQDRRGREYRRRF